MRVPQYQPGAQAIAVPVPQQNPNAPAAAFGQGVANAMGAISADLQKVVDSDALAEANKISADTKLQFSNEFEHRRQTFQTAENPGGDGFATSMLGAFDKHASDTLKKVTNPRAHAYLRDNFNAFRTSLGEAAFRHESKARHDYTNELNAQAYEARERQLSMNPDPINFVSIVADNNAAIDAHPYLDQPAKEALKRKQTEQLAVRSLALVALKDAPSLLAQLNRRIGVPEAETQTGTSTAPAPAAARGMGNLTGNQALVAEKASAAGIDPVMMLAIAHIETGGSFKADAKNPKSTAGGLFQFVDATWGQYGKGSKTDAAASTDAAIALTKDNVAALSQTLGRSPEPWEVYLAHQQGAGGASAILSAGDGISVVEALAAAGVKNAEDAANNNGMKGLTVAQAKEKWRQRYQEAESRYQSAPGEAEAVEPVAFTPEAIELYGQQTGDPRIDSLPPDRLVQVYQQVNTLAKQQEAVGRIVFEDQLKSSTAKAYNGIPDAHPVPDNAFLHYLGPERGVIAAREYRATQRFARDVAQLATASPAEAMVLVQKNAPRPEAPGYAEQASRLATLQAAWKQVEKQREDDAGGYVLQHSYAVAVAYTAMAAAKTPDEARAAAEAFAQASLAEQQRLGIKKQGILPAAHAEQAVAMFNRETSNGDNTATRIAASEQKWGRYWPTVYRQLATEFNGSLPDSFLLIPGLPSNAAREEVARLDHVKAADLEKQLPSADVKGIKDAIQQGLAPFAESLFANQTNSHLYKAIQASAEKMAMARVVGGASTSSATKAALASFIGQYEFSDAHSARKYMVPTKEDPTAVRIGLGQAMAHIQTLELRPPPDATGLRRPDELASEWKETVSKNPLWMTNEDQSGIKLFAIGKDGRPYQVESADGRQVEYKWQQLREMASRKEAEIAARGAVVAPSERTFENMAIAATERERNRILNMPLTPEQRTAALERLK